MYRIFLHIYFFVLLGTATITLVDIGLATPLGVDIKSPFDLTNITQITSPNIYNITNPTDANSTFGKTLNPTNSTEGSGGTLGKITDSFQITLEIIWYFFGLFTGTLVFDVLSIFGVPTYIILALAAPIGFLGILSVAHYLTGKG